MRATFITLACATLLAFAGSAYGQTSVTGKDIAKYDSYDRPVGGVILRLTGGVDLPPPPPDESDRPPIDIFIEKPPVEDPPTFMGEPLEGRFVLLLDASGSMAGSRVSALRAEAAGAIAGLSEDDEFDCVAYGGQFPAHNDYCKFMWQGLRNATPDNRAAAINWVNGPSTNPGGMTPSYSCLKRACQEYPADLQKMFFVSDGYPNMTGSASQILADFPGWWAKFDDCALVCVCIGGGGATFMQQLAALMGGTYVAV